MKKVLIGIYFLIISISYSDTFWSGNYYNDSLVILYKVLDPLIVQVDTPSRIKLPALDGVYKYSEKSDTQKPLRVVVKADYTKERIDDILRKVYEKVHFKLQDSGEFYLKNDNNPDKKIKGNGYFIDKEVGATAVNKMNEIDKEFAGSVGSEKFSAETEIDVDFTVSDGKNLPRGIYTGTLKLDVWFYGSI